MTRLFRWDGKNAEPVMMSMADGGGSAAGQQVHKSFYHSRK